jgi:PRTRC genetic system ThiF family protein
MRHYLSRKLVDPGYSRVQIALAGCGGTGSHLLTGLTNFHKALVERGHSGFHLTVFDPDTVSEANIGRQRFFPSDVGFNKAAVLVTRVNQSCGLLWDAVPDEFTNDRNYDLVISAVDTVKARLEIRSLFNQASYYKDAYWLDVGNQKNSGQIILGTTGEFNQPNAPEGIEYLGRLPCVTDLYDLTQVKEETQGPSCSLAEALEHQDLMINPIIADYAIHLLWTGFNQGFLTSHGYFVNLESESGVRSLPVNREVWKRMGFKMRKPRALKAV